MAGTAGLDWIWYASGAGLGIAGLVLLVWALLWDRSRGRRRCPKCWYDMQGAEADESGAFHCPECGRTITRERKLHKTRRRWRWALLSMALALPSSLTMLAWPAVHDWDARDWVDHLPMTVLVALFQLCDGDASSGILGNLESEVYGETQYWMHQIDEPDSRMADWQWHWAMWHCLNVLEAHSDPVYSIGGFEEWRWQPEYFHTMQQHVAQDVAVGLRTEIGRDSNLVEDILSRFPPTVTPMSPPRTTWVINTEKNIYCEPRFVFEASYPPFVGIDFARTSGRLISPPPEQAESWMPKEFGRDAPPMTRYRLPAPGHYELDYEVDIDVRVVRNKFPDEWEWVHYGTRRVTVEIDVVNQIALAYSPRQGHDVDQAVVNGLRIIGNFGAVPGDRRTIRFGLGAANNEFWHDSMPPEINLELLRNGRPASYNRPWVMHPKDEHRVGEFYFDFVLVDPEVEDPSPASGTTEPGPRLVEAMLANPEQWALHIWNDDPENESEIYSWFDQTARPYFWVGDIVVPLSDLDLSPLKP